MDPAPIGLRSTMLKLEELNKRIEKLELAHPTITKELTDLSTRVSSIIDG